MKLVIVESPAKAKTINKYLGDDFKVIASYGHVRDLPSKNGSVLPDQDFAMKYIISEKAQKYVNEIVKLAAKADNIYLATDPDREGESISWHVIEVIKEHNPKIANIFKRVAFNEITKKAVLEAVRNPRNIDTNLVNAQQARRALDYLVGFTLSPLLWRKLPGCRSAGRVQSVALRLICEREQEIEQFKIQEYWDITLDMLGSSKEPFSARLLEAHGKKLEKFSITNQQEAHKLAEELKPIPFLVHSLEKKQQKRQPPPPFITSSLQQEASRKLGYGTKKTMQIAQKLYEGIGGMSGLITYMRTDGVTLAKEAVVEIRKLIGQNYGQDYLPPASREYKSRVKNAQEAHEAIRPTDISMTPEKLQGKLDTDQLRLYELIWKRTVACQMANVVINMVVAELKSEDKQFAARANGSTIAFDGFYKLYREGRDDEKEEENRLLPALREGERLKTKEVRPVQHFTEPPPRYSEASLVKKMEELGIGRPSTYASIISVLQDRDYVHLNKKRFVPNELGRLVTAFLVGFFKKYVEYEFTAELEEELDTVARGELGWKKLLAKFWQGFDENIMKVQDRSISEVISHIEQALEHHLFAGDAGAKTCPSCEGGQMHLKLGKYGAFLACSNYPDCSFKKTLAAADSQQPDAGSEKKAEDKILGQDNSSGLDVYLKKGPYGWYVQLGREEKAPDPPAADKTKGKKSKAAKAQKPKRASLPPGWLPEHVTLEKALDLLRLPRLVGMHPETGEEILMSIGKFGPYLKHAGAFASIPKKIDPFTVTLPEAVEIIAAKKAKIANKPS